MSAKILDGKELAQQLFGLQKEKVHNLKYEKAITPCLRVIIVGNNPASEIYVRNKDAKAQELGMDAKTIALPESISEADLLKHIHQLNNDKNVHGILVQLPLPNHINSINIINAIHPDKDVDGFHVENVGKMVTGQDGKVPVPCTPLGCLLLLRKAVCGDFMDFTEARKKLSGMHAVIIGRSNIVGKPMAMLLLQENCTITIAHSHTRNIEEICRQADIVVAAVGKPEMVKGSWLKKDAIVIDVGINRIALPNGKTKLVGDVAFDECEPIASYITPVPGGVGPMTIACLMENTFIAACRQNGINPFR